jgi:molecular chaperone DnaK
MGKIIGIDLGTTNSLVAVMEGGKPTIIPNLLGKRMTPSVVWILENGKYIVGEKAANSLITDPKNTIAGIKRFMGRRYNEVMDLVPAVPFDVVLGRNNLAMVRCHSIDYSPQVISAMILQYLKASAEKYLRETITEAIITVPASFGDREKQATKEAGIIAGLKVIRIINEPTAASMAYGFGKEDINETIAIFDLGGGTFDITILEVGIGVFNVLSINGDEFLGGDDFDNRIIDWMLDEIQWRYGVNLSNNPLAIQRIAEVAIQAKCTLSSSLEAEISIPWLIQKDAGFVDLNLPLTRSKFEDISEELFERLKIPCEHAIRDAKISTIDKVILVGGATRMTKVAEVIREVFETEPKSSVNPDEAVAIGAAIQAGLLAGNLKGLLLLDVTAHSLGVETSGGVTTRIIPRNTTIPLLKSVVFSTLLDGQTSVEIHILEGEKELGSDNRTLGRFILDGICPAPQGVPLIEVTFDIDANAILNVTAKDRAATGKEESLTVIVSTGISESEIEIFSDIVARNIVLMEKMQLE